MTPDTPPAAVERLRRWRDVGDGPPNYTAGDEQFAADVVALLAERDQWIANSRENKLIAEANLRDVRKAEAERDAALCDLAQARASISHVAAYANRLSWDFKTRGIAEALHVALSQPAQDGEAPR